MKQFLCMAMSLLPEEKQEDREALDGALHTLEELIKASHISGITIVTRLTFTSTLGLRVADHAQAAFESYLNEHNIEFQICEHDDAGGSGLPKEQPVYNTDTD